IAFERAIEELLDDVESLGAMSPCAAQHAAHLVMAAGANRPRLIDSAIEAAQRSSDLSRVRLFRAYQRLWADGKA
ncbi:MAG TPA: hypothetical protein PK867_26275, partial [Pirellulales bacterium]|nr:hypothetical protein [Pirellulales bacterium]